MGNIKRNLGLVVGAAVTAQAVWKYLKDRREKEEKAASSPALVSVQASTEPDRPDAGDHVWIYFGSQSGTAEGFSKELEQEASDLSVKCTVVDLEEFDPETFAKHKVVVLVVATYGEGDPTDNSMDFFKWLEDAELSKDTLEGMKFTVMGLGNSQYQHFNSCGKLADKRLEELGAKRVHERGEGDDDVDIQEDFEQWKQRGLWDSIQNTIAEETGVTRRRMSSCDSEGGMQLATADEAKSKLQLHVAFDSEKGAIDPLVQAGGADVLGKWYFQASVAPIVVCKELRQVTDVGAGKTTKHLDFCIKQINTIKQIQGFPALEWKTADNLEILPRNPEVLVDWFATRLGVEDKLNSSLTFVRAPGVQKAVKMPFPTPCLARDALELYCDLSAAPTRAAARHLAAFATNEEDRAFLKSLLQDKETYKWLVGQKVQLSFREFFELFLPSAEVDLGTFLQVCPRQKSRPYTIASSSLEDPHRIGVCVSMVLQDALPSLAELAEELATRGHPVPKASERLAIAANQGTKPRRFEGLCSTMLCNRSVEDDKLMIFARTSSFRLPQKTSSPVVMIGAGTGIAPFRGFVREFVAEGGVRPKTVLFFGCTKSTEDFVYRDELQDARSSEPAALKDLVTAFSREQSHKIYVQHRVTERADVIKQYIAEGGYVYVCGAVSMGKSIRDELASMLGSVADVERIQKEGRFIEELW